MEEFNKSLEKYKASDKQQQISKKTRELLSHIPKNPNKELVKKLFSLIDLTSLNTDDSPETGEQISAKVNSLSETCPNIPNVAAICVYPSLVSTVKRVLEINSVKIAAVGAGFPSSQTFLSIKLAECKLLVEKGADEIDIVISVGRFLHGDFQHVFDEIQLIKSTIGDVHLKVILETGLLITPENIRTASLLAMEAGADFIKTSTGKLTPSASPEAVVVMLIAIRDFNEFTGKKVGIKPAGGIANLHDALTYYTLVDHILGKEWIHPELFRIGASRLANNLLSDIYERHITHF